MNNQIHTTLGLLESHNKHIQVQLLPFVVDVLEELECTNCKFEFMALPDPHQYLDQKEFAREINENWHCTFNVYRYFAFQYRLIHNVGNNGEPRFIHKVAAQDDQLYFRMSGPFQEVNDWFSIRYDNHDGITYRCTEGKHTFYLKVNHFGEVLRRDDTYIVGIKYFKVGRRAGCCSLLWLFRLTSCKQEVEESSCSTCSFSKAPMVSSFKPNGDEFILFQLEHEDMNRFMTELLLALDPSELDSVVISIGGIHSLEDVHTSYIDLGL